jgi:hypothetical protein
MPRQKSTGLRIRSRPVQRGSDAPGRGLGAPGGRDRRRPWLPGLLLAAGCSLYQDVRVVSNPPGAEVFVDQNRAGETPVELRLSRERDHSVYVKKDGYTPELVVVKLRSATDGRNFLTPADVFVDLLHRSGLPEAEASPSGSGSTAGASRAPAAQGLSERDRNLRIEPGEPREAEKKRR